MWWLELVVSMAAATVRRASLLAAKAKPCCEQHEWKGVAQLCDVLDLSSTQEHGSQPKSSRTKTKQVC